MADTKIRPMVKPDKAAVMNILGDTPEFSSVDVNVAEELIDCYLSDGTESGYHILVSESNARINGYICFGPTPLTEGTWDIYWIAVARAKRGQGIGGALVAAIEEQIRAKSGRLIVLETSGTPAYEATRRFHFHQGFDVISRIPDFYAVGDDKVIFWKRLG